MTKAIKELCSEGEFLISDDSTLNDAVRVMRQNNKGVVVIGQNGRIDAILTERDIVNLLSKGIDLDNKAIEFATKNPIVVKSDRSILHALIIMTENDIRRVVVLDDDGNFLGVVTHKDLVVHIEDDAYRSNLKIRHIHQQTKRIVYADPDDQLISVLKLMSSNNISAIPIFEGSKAVGIITEKDILDVASKGLALETKAKEIMHSPVLCVEVENLVVETVKLMNKNNVRRVLVEDSNGNCVGIITQKDILRNFESDYRSLVNRKLKHTKDLLNLLPEMVLEVLDGKDEQLIVWANRKSVEFFGKKVVDQRIENILGYDSWVSLYMRVTKHGVVEQYKCRSGEHIFEITGFYMRSEDPDERGRIKLMVRDITKSEVSQANVKGELETYLRIINSTDDIILLYGAYDGKIKIVNESTLKSLGLTKEEI